MRNTIEVRPQPGDKPQRFMLDGVGWIDLDGKGTARLHGYALETDAERIRFWNDLIRQVELLVQDIERAAAEADGAP